MIDDFAECFCDDVDESNGAIVFGVACVLAGFWNEYHEAFFVSVGVFTCRERVIENFCDIDENNFGEMKYLDPAN